MRHGGLRIFLAGQAVSLVGDGIAILAVPLLMLTVTTSPLAVAFSSIPRMAGYLLVGLPAGALVDRMNPRVVMFVADAVRAAAFLLLAFWAYHDDLSVAGILAVSVITGIATVFFESALAIAVKDLAGDSRLVQVNSFLQTASQIGLVVGPGIVGALLATVGLTTAMVVDAMTFAVSMVTLALLGRMYQGTPFIGVRGFRNGLRTVGSDLREGLRYIRSSRTLLILTALPAALNLFLAAETLVVYYAKVVLHASDLSVSAVVISGGIGGVLGAALTSPIARRVGEQRLIATGIAGLGLAIGSMGLIGLVPWLVVANLLAAAGTMLATVVIQSLRQRIVPRQLLGRVTSTIRMLVLSIYPAGTALAGTVTSLAGGDPRPVLVGAGVLSTAVVGIAWVGGLRDAPADLNRSDENAGPTSRSDPQWLIFPRFSSRRPRSSSRGAKACTSSTKTADDTSTSPLASE